MYLICKSAHFVLTGPAPVDIRLKTGQLEPLQRERCRAFPRPAPAFFRSFKNTLVYDIIASLLIGRQSLHRTFAKENLVWSTGPNGICDWDISSMTFPGCGG
jgi:hypothetical protein